MDSVKELPDLFKNSSPTTMRRLRTSFLAFCLTTLAVSMYLLWNYGATLPRVFHGIEDVDDSVQGGVSVDPAATNTQSIDITSLSTSIVAPESSSVPAQDSQSDKGAGLDESGSTHLPYFDLVWWLRSIGRFPGEPLIFMIASNAEMALTFNMHETFEKYGNENNFFVLCLEKACLDAPEIFTYDVVGMNKNSVKIAASAQLLRERFSFVFIDPDVYLTGSIDPFSVMLPLSDPDWDIQFFPGPARGAKGIDASFFYARPNEPTKEFFKRVKKNWKESGDQDLNSLMNVMAFEMFSGDGTLKMKILGSKEFRGWGDMIEWESKNYNNYAAMNIIQNETAVVHMTCVEPSLRSYIARNFGAWYDVESYYSGKRKFLAVKGLEGDASHASKIIGFAAKVAMDSYRTLIFPSSAILTQARKNAQTGASDYVTVPEFPAYRIVNPSSLYPLSLRLVEATYLNNRARYTDEHLTEDTIIMGNGHSAKDPTTGKPVVVKTVLDKAKVDIIWLDMGSGRWWDLDASGAMASYTREVQNVIKTCSNANEEFFECDKRCI
ncbi:hypothetical protein AOL_s00076g532 [Orbilia oligospora ATCC 24927]|uniref:Nucleotide-diphospho-sugar transferase domain-containing protein n=2 Tax=Orbilia oligospora TaxID=2813651 RepID=G1XA74_ARTOA|nr:hypothetical protein AOL_s00076g532 [Orbilia oligospora ATCC 24927]EGX49891.1 hypothetical protein AOL_s00076g532 [Orbilia oligospora ATCC 24927]KAF3276112.1 hypothetical protein TWF970_006397 [Orbilia oligospora]